MGLLVTVKVDRVVGAACHRGDGMGVGRVHRVRASATTRNAALFCVAQSPRRPSRTFALGAPHQASDRDREQQLGITRIVRDICVKIIIYSVAFFFVEIIRKASRTI